MSGSRRFATDDLFGGELARGNHNPLGFRATVQNGRFTLRHWGKRGKLKAEVHLVRDIGLHLFVRHVGDVAIVDIHGKATIGRANDLLDNQLQQLIDEGNDKILLNLTDVTQMDSSSISSVIRAFKSLERRGASLRLTGPRGNVRLVLNTVHLLDVVPTTEDESQAIDSFH
jgi:anti-sigma B factor antagonist